MGVAMYLMYFLMIICKVWTEQSPGTGSHHWSVYGVEITHNSCPISV